MEKLKEKDKGGEEKVLTQKFLGMVCLGILTIVQGSCAENSIIIANIRMEVYVSWKV